MNEIRIIDAHCDTLTHLLDKPSTIKDSSNQVNINRLKSGKVFIQFFAAWIGPEHKYGPPLQRGIQLIKRFHSMLKEHKKVFSPIYEFKNIENIKNNQIGALLSVEGGDILEGNLSNLEKIYNLGVRLLTLTWNHSNEICDGIMEKGENNGLTSFGRFVIDKMNDLNMIIDISHISEQGFWDVIEYSEQPIIASHSNAQSLCPHPRNLNDDQIIAISKAQGVIGINFYSPFLADKNAKIDDIIHHIEYIAGLGGIDIVGFGSDFDGIDQLPKGVEGPHDFPNIIERLLQLNYPEEDVKKICFENFLNILKTI